MRVLDFAYVCKGNRELPLLIYKNEFSGCRLAFNNTSNFTFQRICMNVTPSPMEYAEGLPCLLPNDLLRLDGYESVPAHYIKRTVQIWNANFQRRVKATVYAATGADGSLRSTKEYPDENEKVSWSYGLKRELDTQDKCFLKRSAVF